MFSQCIGATTDETANLSKGISKQKYAFNNSKYTTGLEVDAFLIFYIFISFNFQLRKKIMISFNSTFELFSSRRSNAYTTWLYILHETNQCINIVAVITDDRVFRSYIRQCSHVNLEKVLVSDKESPPYSLNVEPRALNIPLHQKMLI